MRRFRHNDTHLGSAHRLVDFSPKIPRAVPVGMALCLAGGIALIGRSMELDTNHVKGDVFGLFTALFFGLYFFAVQSARKASGAARATFGLSLVTAPILAIAALLNGDRFYRTGFPAMPHCWPWH